MRRYAAQDGRGCSICATAARCCGRRPKCSPDFRRGAACRNGARTFTATAPTGPTTRRPREPAREVVLFADTFNRYFERENLDAAMRVLVAGGYRVHAAMPKDGDARPLCCGRTFLAVGQVDEAKREMERTLAALAPYVARGVPVIGLEPSCLFTLPRRVAGADQERSGRGAGGAGAAAGGISRPRAEAQAGSICRSGRSPRRRCCTAIATRRRSTPWARSRACCRLIPELARRNRGVELLRHGRRVRLRRRHHRRVAQDGRAVVAAGGAKERGRHADRGRRHLVPASDP